MKPVFAIIFCMSVMYFTVAQPNYTFIGKGLWNLPSNWHNNGIPPSTLPAGSNIYIYPALGDTCILNVNQTISQGATLNTENAIFVISIGAILNAGGTVAIKVNKNDSIQICTQKWMNKNLDVVKYRNGDPIPQVTNSADWGNLTTGAWCYYGNDPANGAVYGKLYNWYAVNDSRGLAPIGWHIPTWQEWVALSDCLGGDAASAGPMKETGTAHWTTPNTGATNVSGFTALAAGWRGQGGGFSSKGFQAYWWSTNYFASIYPWSRMLEYTSTVAGGGGNVETHGFSIRCVKD